MSTDNERAVFNDLVNAVNKLCSDVNSVTFRYMSKIEWNQNYSQKLNNLILIMQKILVFKDYIKKIPFSTIRSVFIAFENLTLNYEIDERFCKNRKENVCEICKHIIPLCKEISYIYKTNLRILFHILVNISQDSSIWLNSQVFQKNLKFFLNLAFLTLSNFNTSADIQTDDGLYLYRSAINFVITVLQNDNINTNEVVYDLNIRVRVLQIKTKLNEMLKPTAKIHAGNKREFLKLLKIRMTCVLAYLIPIDTYARIKMKEKYIRSLVAVLNHMKLSGESNNKRIVIMNTVTYMHELDYYLTASDILRCLVRLSYNRGMAKVVTLNDKLFILLSHIFYKKRENKIEKELCCVLLRSIRANKEANKECRNYFSYNQLQMSVEYNGLLQAKGYFDKYLKATNNYANSNNLQKKVAAQNMEKLYSELLSSFSDESVKKHYVSLNEDFPIERVKPSGNYRDWSQKAVKSWLCFNQLHFFLDIFESIDGQLLEYLIQLKNTDYRLFNYLIKNEINVNKHFLVHHLALIECLDHLN